MKVLQILYSEIRKKLWSDRKDDPDVRVEIDIDEDVYEMYLVSL